MTENDNVYLNIVFNHDDSQGNKSTAAVYNSYRSAPIIAKCNDYYCSVVRFDLPLDTVPLFIMPITNNPNDMNESSLIIGMTDTNNQNPVSFNIAFWPAVDMPVPSVGQQTSPYYYVYSYNHMIDMINFKLAEAYANAFNGQPASNAPYFVYNGTTQLISLMLPEAYATTSSVIFMNNELSTFLDAFQLYSYGDNQPLGRDFDINFRDGQINDTNHVMYNNNNYYQITQEYSTLPMWSQLRKILILTNSIPINAEYIQINDSSQNVTLPVITDFVLSFNQAGDSRSLAVYNPTSQYRLIDLISTGDLYNINLQVYWVDRLGNRNPLLLSVFQQGSVKIAFLKKELYRDKQNNGLLKKEFMYN